MELRYIHKLPKHTSGHLDEKLYYIYSAYQQCVLYTDSTFSLVLEDWTGRNTYEEMAVWDSRMFCFNTALIFIYTATILHTKVFKGMELVFSQRIFSIWEMSPRVFHLLFQYLTLQGNIIKGKMLAWPVPLVENVFVISEMLSFLIRSVAREMDDKFVNMCPRRARMWNHEKDALKQGRRRQVCLGSTKNQNDCWKSVNYHFCITIFIFTEKN